MLADCILAKDSWYNRAMRYIVNSKVFGTRSILLDDEDGDRVLSMGKWSLGKRGSGVYATKLVKGKRVYMHRVVNNTPKGLVTDHINGNTLDNRKSNLRACTVSANLRNAPNTKGVYWLPKRKKWLAMIMVKRKSIFIGHFDTKKEALEARRLVAKEHWSV